MSISEKCGASTPVSAFIKMVGESARTLLPMSSWGGNPVAVAPGKNVIAACEAENPSASDHADASMGTPRTLGSAFLPNTTWPFERQ
jgi:hypothetical protein